VQTSWKVTEFKIQIFQAQKVTESGLGPGKSRKINQIVATFYPRTLPAFMYCLLSDLVWHFVSTTLSSNTVELQLREIDGKS